MAAIPTIYALASAAGKSGVAVFRLSGPVARQGVTCLGVPATLVPRHATRVTLKTPEDVVLDDALVLYFPAPHSFTGEDVIELHTHGSRAVTKLLLEVLGSLPGMRMAEPGEFARRAFLNGKLDLAQVEGLADLIDAETQSQHAQAMRQLGGQMTQRIDALRSAILEPLALMEAYIDFPDEEIPESVLSQAQRGVAAVSTEIAALLDDGSIGEKIREGLEIVILGAPNAGKSSLLNTLARREAAIVSPEAGTTRDLIEVAMEIGGYAVTLVDTAGLREAKGNVEAEGIRRAQQRAAHADIRLHLSDSGGIAAEAASLGAGLGPATLVVATKADLAPLPVLPFPALAVSTVTGQGLPELIQALQQLVEERMESVASPLITRARHRAALQDASSALARFHVDAPLELACEELRRAAASIGKITGKIWVDDVLDLVFSRFCIGK